MKKAIRPALSILAIAHLVAILGFVTYLGASDRLNRERLDQIRSILAVTLTQEREQAQAEQEAAEEAARQAKRDAETDIANAGAESRNEQFRTIEQAVDEQIRRARRDTQAMMQLLDLRLAEVQRREAELASREAAVEAAIKRDADLARDEQFRKTVNLLSGLKPDDLKAKIDVYLADGLYDFVIDVLVAIPARTASKLLALYADETENRLAAELLLRLRDRGAAPSAPAQGRDGADAPRDIDGRPTASQQP